MGPVCMYASRGRDSHCPRPWRPGVKFEQIPLFYPRGCATTLRGIALERFVAYCSSELIISGRALGRGPEGTGDCSSCYALPKRQKDISHIQVCVPLLQCKPNAVVSSPITHLCAKIGALDPGPLRLASNNRNSCLEILDAESYYDPKGPFIHRDYPFLNIMFYRLSRIITSSSSLPDSGSS